MKSAQSKTSTMRRHRSQRPATDTVSPATRLAQRVGFTLVELLMVIVIIGILVAMLAVAINPVLQTARETTVAIEMKQIDLAIEQFNTKYGFYPPSFIGFDPRPATTAANSPPGGAQLLPFLNKISPNHQEGNGAPGTRLSVWWNAIGSNLTDSGSLIFWLNGLSNNKQFPITGGLANVDAAGNAVTTGGNFQLPVIFNADLVVRANAAGVVQQAVINGEMVNEFDVATMDSTGAVVGPPIEREALFDFKGGQLSDQFFDGTGLAPTGAGIRVYNSPHGNQKFDLAYRYRNSAFYDLADPVGTTSTPVGGRSRDAFHISVVNANGMPDQVFLNPNTFQLSTFGLDGRASGFASTAINQPVISGTPEEVEGLMNWQALNGDNIANFANGRLDGFDWTEEVELGNREPQ